MKMVHHGQITSEPNLIERECNSCGIYKSHSQSSIYKSKRKKHKHEKMNATIVESINCMYTKLNLKIKE
jgi:hypothetical protein